MNKVPNASKDARNADIVQRRLQGATMESLAADYGITRQRVDQICTKAGVNIAVRDIKREAAAQRKAEKAASLNKFAARHGLTNETYKQYLDAGITQWWRELKRNCANRGIPFDLTLAQYGSIVGKFPIGRGAGKYVLSIRNREIGYVLGNVVLRSYSSNSRATRARDTDVPRLAPSEGVYLLYPGCLKPYAARAHGKNLGNYATVEEAIEARRLVLAT